MRQVIAEAYLQEPDVASLYYPREDQLLVAFYNKRRQLNEYEDPQTAIDGEREWRAAYRVMPDFENWLHYFSDQLVIQQTQKDSAIPKYQFDEEMIPDSLLDIDDRKIQNIEEKSQMLYPDDNSVMKVDTFEIAGKKYTKSSVMKDNLTFGLRKAEIDSSENMSLEQLKEKALQKFKKDGPNAKEEEDPDKEYGLYSYNRLGDTELWINFENNTKLLAEYVGMNQNSKKLIRIDPPKPTPEEIKEREDAIKAAQALAAKNRGKNNSQLGQIPVVEEYKEPDPTWEPESLTFLDQCY